METTQYDCTGCRRSWKLSQEAATDQLEVTTVYDEDGAHEVLVCSLCGQLVEPRLSQGTTA